MAIQELNEMNIGGVSGASSTKTSGKKVGGDKVGSVASGSSLSGTSILAFSDMLIGSYHNSEVMEKLGEKLKEVYDKIDVAKPVLLKFPKGKYEFDYDMIVAAMQDSDTKKVIYLGLVLEASGKEPAEPGIILEELAQRKANQDIPVVASDSMQDFIYDTIEEVLAKRFNVSVEKIVSLESIVIPHNEELESVNTLAAYVYDLLVTNLGIEAGKARDLSIEDFKTLGNGYFDLTVGFNNKPIKNRIGRLTKSDYTINCEFIKQSAVRGGAARRKPISLTSGYLDFLIEETIDRFGKSMTLATPLVIINEKMTTLPTFNNSILATLNALVFNNQNVMRKAIIEKDVGSLNYLFNFGGEAGKPGEKISFKDPSADPVLVNQIIAAQFKQHPVYMLELELNGDTYPIDRALLGTTEADATIYKFINDRLSTLLNTDVEVNNVLATNPHEVPIGEFVDKHGEVRDIREIDLSYILNYTEDPRIIQGWIYSNVPVDQCQAATGKTNFELRLELLDELSKMLGIEMVITGRAIRLPLHSELLAVLESESIRRGYNVRLNAPTIGQSNVTDLRAVAGVYSNAEFAGPGIGTGINRPTYRASYSPRGF